MDKLAVHRNKLAVAVNRNELAVAVDKVVGCEPAVNNMSVAVDKLL